jgi:hypothetical protein
MSLKEHISLKYKGFATLLVVLSCFFALSFFTYAIDADTYPDFSEGYYQDQPNVSEAGTCIFNSLQGKHVRYHLSLRRNRYNPAQVLKRFSESVAHVIPTLEGNTAGFFNTHFTFLIRPAYYIFLFRFTLF